MGSLAPGEGEPVVYTWRWCYSVTGLGLLVVLFLATVVPKANRTPKVLLILAPLAVVLAGWFVFASMMGGTSSDRAMFDVMILTLAVGSATLWLLAHRLALGAWYKRLLAAMGIGLGVALVGGLWFGFGADETIDAMVLSGVMMIAMVLGYALAVRGYRSRLAWRFLLFQAAGNVVACLAGALVCVFVLMFIVANGVGSIHIFLMAAVVGGLITGGIVFLVSLPFAILGLYSPFFRQRLILCTPSRPAAEVDNL
ncbi:MAG: hypothetical protein ABFD90_03975 [Phycisphaerales bacterium]